MKLHLTEFIPDAVFNYSRPKSPELRLEVNLTFVASGDGVPDYFNFYGKEKKGFNKLEEKLRDALQVMELSSDFNFLSLPEYDKIKKENETMWLGYLELINKLDRQINLTFSHVLTGNGITIIMHPATLESLKKALEFMNEKAFDVSKSTYRGHEVLTSENVLIDEFKILANV